MSSYKLNEAKIFADVTDGIAVLIDSDTGIYYGLNGFGTQVYENIVKRISIEKILKKIKSFEGVPDTIESDLKLFLDTALEKSILFESDENDEEVILDESIVKEDNFTLELKEYDDAQELLLTDPIHEVKEEIGWTPEKDSIGYTKEETKEREKKMEK